MTGIIKKVDVPPTEQTEGQAQEQTNSSESSQWYLEDGIPGVGERPQWLEAKFKNVKELATSYKELEKFKGVNKSVPEDYDWGDYKELFDVENEHLADLKNKAKELKLSQDEFKNILDPLAAYHKSLMPDVDAEIAKLGDHAQNKINTVNTWASNHLSDKALETLGKISHTADVFQLMDEIRQLHYQTVSKVPTNMQAQSKVDVITPEQVQEKIVNNYDLYQKDSAFRAKMQQELQQALGEE